MKTILGLLLLFINIGCDQVDCDDLGFNAIQLIPLCVRIRNINEDIPKIQILSSISFLESTSGKNRIHAMQTTGIHAGTYSYSSFGLMPVSVVEISIKSSKFNKSDLGKQISKLDPKTDMKSIHAITSDVTKDTLIANFLWDYNKNQVSKFTNKEHQIEVNAYAWRYGVNAAKDIYTKFGIEKIRKADYVRKFNEQIKGQKFLQSFNNPKSEQWKEFFKTLTKKKSKMSWVTSFMEKSQKGTRYAHKN